MRPLRSQSLALVGLLAALAGACSGSDAASDAGARDARTADARPDRDGIAPDAALSDGAAGDAAEPGPDGAPRPPPPPPPPTCDAPPPLDVSSPSAVVGVGNPSSCTEDELRRAASSGGTIVFDCGPDPVTITVSSAITFTTETVLDGGGLVTLSGGGTSRILFLDSAYDQTTPRLTVQRLAFRDGASAAGGDDTAVGGGAIHRDGGSLTVVDCVFTDNHAPSPGQDIAGGAIYGFGGGDTIIAGSTFTRNSASNGGAVGSLNGDLTIVNSVLRDNAATGTDGNPGNGGCGGALYMDGRDERTTLCGVTISGNTAGAIGGAFFRVSNDHTGSFSMDRTTVDGNRVTATESGNAGGLYLEGLALTIQRSTISRNRAFYNGGIWINTCTVEMTNTTIAENVAFGSNGGGIWLGHSPTGTILNCTIANNRSTAEGQVAGGIFGEGLTLVNTIVAGNTAMYNPTCSDTRADGSGNVQWPEGSLCTGSPLVADPMLGELGDHGGDTETMVPSGASPARGVGTGCPTTDQIGNPRSDPCTAGAVEAP
ncbi:MAG: right-handed parallel beta-helix repeat-containing protein [Deltaproteobacteria bacterium]|nr:right-handed parallel beta-helix repeat-containing protein [Deltaproteobacteria bacterium]